MRSRVSIEVRALTGILLAAAACGLGPAAFVAQADTAPQHAAWSIQASIAPTRIAPGEEGVITDLVRNVGAAPTDGSIVSITDRLPAGLEVAGTPEGLSHGLDQVELGCQAIGPEVSCSFEGPLGANSVDGPFTGRPATPFQGGLEVRIPVIAVGGEAGLENRISVEGGGTPQEESTQNVPVGAGEPGWGLESFSFAPLQSSGGLDTQAGDHPNLLEFELALNTRREPPGGNGVNAVGKIKDLVLELPIGFSGDPLAAATCPQESVILSSGIGCPLASVIGTPFLRGVGSAEWTDWPSSSQAPFFNVTPEPDVPAQFGLTVSNAPAPVYAEVAPSPQGYVLRTVSPNIPKVAYVNAILLSLFGDPGAQNGSGGNPAPFFTDPSRCGGPPLSATVHVDSWENPAPISTEPDGKLAISSADFNDPQWASRSVSLPASSGCEKLQYQPTFNLAPDTTAADSPAGVNFDLKVPQTTGFHDLATPDLRDATVVLPKGATVNAASAGGLQGCTSAQIDLASSRPGNCPAASQIATVDIHTPLLSEPLSGQVFIGTPECSPCGVSDAQSGRLLHGYIQAIGSGVVIKLPGDFTLDPGDGQITAHFEENPQLPFDDLDMQFKSGPRAPVTTPPTCGTFTTRADLKPWSAPQSGPDAAPQSTFQISGGANGSPCAATESALPNAPAFEAGTQTPIAGAYSPFVLRLSREDGSQRIASIDTTLPGGLLARLASTPYCPDASLAAAAGRSGAAEQASPSCPAASQVGSVEVAAGAGTNPFQVGGRAYLAGPYKGAPLSLAIITPALAGPFDLGTVVVRTALHIDETSTQVRAVSDPIPSMLAGIPLDVRQIVLRLDKPNFTLNPTSCDPKQITAQAISTLEDVAPLTQRFQVGACRSLAFKPRLAISLKGSTRHAGHPALKAVLTYPKGGGYANIARAQVNLPHSEFIDQSNLNKTCTRPVLLAGACPASTIYGRAKAWSPLLAAPLEGPVYLVGGFGYKLPALVAELDGQIRVLLAGKVDSGPNKGIRNTFEAVPDAPVERFELNLKGGPRYSLLENSENLCARPQRAIARFTAQNGATLKVAPKIAISCGRAGRHGRHHKGSKGRLAGH